MMFLPFSPPPSTSFFPVFLLLLLFLPPSLVSSSLFHTPLSWTSPHDPCYHLDGRPRHCLSEFINAAYGVPVNASHSLQGSDYDSNVTTLTDLHNPHNLTCWMAQLPSEESQKSTITLLGLNNNGRSVSYHPNQTVPAAPPGPFHTPAAAVRAS